MGFVGDNDISRLPQSYLFTKVHRTSGDTHMMALITWQKHEHTLYETVCLCAFTFPAVVKSQCCSLFWPFFPLCLNFYWLFSTSGVAGWLSVAPLLLYLWCLSFGLLFSADESSDCVAWGEQGARAGSLNSRGLQYLPWHSITLCPITACPLLGWFINEGRHLPAVLHPT